MGCVTWLSLGHEFTVGGAGGCAVFVVFFELEAQFDGVLFEASDLLVKSVDVDGRYERGLAPGALTERFGQAFLELLDAAVQSDRAFVGGEQVGLQRCSGDGGAGVVAVGGWCGFEDGDLFEQVTVSIGKRPVHGRGPGDAGDADLCPVGQGAVDRGDYAPAVSGGVGKAQRLLYGSVPW